MTQKLPEKVLYETIMIIDKGNDSVRYLGPGIRVGESRCVRSWPFIFYKTKN